MGPVWEITGTPYSMHPLVEGVADRVVGEKADGWVELQPLDAPLLQPLLEQVDCVGAAGVHPEERDEPSLVALRHVGLDPVLALGAEDGIAQPLVIVGDQQGRDVHPGPVHLLNNGVGGGVHVRDQRQLRLGGVAELPEDGVFLRGGPHVAVNVDDHFSLRVWAVSGFLTACVRCPTRPPSLRRGIVSEGHPFDRLRAGSQTPGKGALPLCTPFLTSQRVLGADFESLRFRGPGPELVGPGHGLGAL